MNSSWQRDISKRNPAGVFLCVTLPNCTGSAAPEKKMRRKNRMRSLTYRKKKITPGLIFRLIRLIRGIFHIIYGGRSAKPFCWTTGRNFCFRGRPGRLWASPGDCGYLHQARGGNCRPEQVIIGAGNEYLEILLMQILKPGQRGFDGKSDLPAGVPHL